jgi:SAM-dependent methyltransferase
MNQNLSFPGHSWRQNGIFDQPIKYLTMSLSSLHPTQRFSDRADNYAKYRPTYPQTIIAYLRETIHLNRKHTIADIGSGTGIFSELFLKHGFRVIGVEPNEAMRLAGEANLGHNTHFTSVDGRAEATGLQTGSVDLITVAQAFHWLEPVTTKVEFSRILREGGHILLVWNLRLTDTPFLKGLDDLKKAIGKNYEAINGSHADETAIRVFFSPAEVTIKTFRHAQIMDFESLKGQLLSSSYMPQEGSPGYPDMIEGLEDLFHRYNENGQVNMEYETKLFLG